MPIDMPTGLRVDDLPRHQQRRLRKLLKRMHTDRGFLSFDELAERAWLARHLAKIQEGGKVGISWRAMSCDCVLMTGATTVPANVMALVRWKHQFYDGAEGPQSYQLVRPSALDGFEPETRDLALEAHEDGHPHVVYA